MYLFQQLVAGDAVFKPEDVAIGDRLPALAGLPLDLLGDLEVHEQGAHHAFGDLVARDGGHRIGADAAAVGDSDIRSAGAHIDQRDIEQPQLLRDHRIDRGDRLEGDAGNAQPDL